MFKIKITKASHDKKEKWFILSYFFGALNMI